MRDVPRASRWMAVIGVALACVGAFVTWLSIRGREPDAVQPAIRLCEREQAHEDAGPASGRYVDGPAG